MQTVYNVLLIVSVVVAVVFTLMVYLTGKGDAMSGGAGSVRTTFKGKASIDDKIAGITIGLGLSFMVLMITLDVIAARSL